jgi:hypothetical protein
MQIVPVVRESWNKRKGESWTHDDLLNPELNVRIAADLLNRIITGYQKHPSKNMKADWSNPEFVNLLVAGWNAGYSEAGGVGRVASYLEERGIPVTHDNIYKYAQAAGATKFLSMPGRLTWQKSVTDLYFRQPDAPTPGQSSSSWGLLVVGAAALLGIFAFKHLDLESIS